MSKPPQNWLLTSKVQLHRLSQRKQPWVQQEVRLSRNASREQLVISCCFSFEFLCRNRSQSLKRVCRCIQDKQHAFRIGFNGRFFQVSPFVFVQKQWFKQKGFQINFPHVGSNWWAIHNLLSVIHNISNIFVANRNSARYQYHQSYDYFDRRLSDSVRQFINTIVNNWFG